MYSLVLQCVPLSPVGIDEQSTVRHVAILSSLSALCTHNIFYVGVSHRDTCMPYSMSMHKDDTSLYAPASMLTKPWIFFLALDIPSE